MERVPNWSGDGDWPSLASVRAIRNRKSPISSAFTSAASNAGCRPTAKRGMAGLKAKPAPGRPPKLSLAQERQVLRWFRQSPRSFGFPTELWTAPRVTDVIQRKFRKKFHPHYINQWLARAADHAAEAGAASPRTGRAGSAPLAARGVAADKKSARRRRAHLVLIDESGFLMSPLVRRTLAPRGHTPILKTKAAHREKVSVTAALTISPQRHRLGLYWRTYPREFRERRAGGGLSSLPACGICAAR